MSGTKSPAVNPEEQFQVVQLNVDPGAERKKLANAIATTKYTWYTWLPKSIWEQFRRIANIYFLYVSILMLIGYYAPVVFSTPLNPYSTIVTLVFVLLVTSAKEGVEDLKRAKSDEFENNRDVFVITFSPTGEEIETLKKSKHVNPGDILKLKGQCAVPVDMVLMLTSLHNDGNKCFIETANIDGETNLKVKEAPPLFADNFPDHVNEGRASRELFEGSVEVQIPNKNIHKFTGTLTLNASKETIPLGIDNVVLRSSLFSNTDWGYGIAIYTGQSTKIQMNNRHAPSKMSKLEKALNTAILIIFAAQIVLVAFAVGSIYMTGSQHLTDYPYVYPNGTKQSVLPLWLEMAFVFQLLFNNFIPISLYVTIELVNIGQALLVSNDIEMYNEQLDVSCAVRSSNLLQELGMVSNIFTDKTGTLTRNEMKFVKFVLNGFLYDVLPSSVPPPTGGSKGEGEKKDDSTTATASTTNSSATSATAKRALEEQLSTFGANRDAFIEFARCLATCHTVVREKSGAYRAESPDELALVEGAGNYQCGLLERGSREMIVEFFGERKTYEVLAVNPFDADRKRMSVLIRDQATSQYFVMCKGADSIMMPLCTLTNAAKSDINQSLLDLANMGLRTLVVASKPLDAKSAQAWLTEYKAATISTVNRAENIARVGAQLEVNMNCLGITAIEDRLQDEVPEVIADLTKAGIIVWMLTGDKLETAINIGHSCNLLLHDTVTAMITNCETKDEFRQRLLDEYEKIIREPVNPNTALVIDGRSFLFFDPKDLQERSMLLRIGQGCRSVIACRLTPTQKREMVLLVKRDTKPSATTLSIGDGANDVSMILEANVGVGIYGKEGRQAANNADFAIGEFKFLRRLVLLHGRYNYIRQSTVFLYSMHKNMVITLTLFWYSYYSALSGTSLYESWIYTGYNFILGLPVIFFGMLDRDLSIKFVLENPQVYNTGKSNSMLRPLYITGWIFNAVIYAVVFNMLVFYVAAPTFKDWAVYPAGLLIFVALCNSLQMKVAFFHHQWAWPNWLMFAISLFGMLVYFLIISAAEYDFYYIANYVYLQGFYWFYAFFTVPLFVVFIDWFTYYTRMIFFPTNQMLYEEANRLEDGRLQDFWLDRIFGPTTTVGKPHVSNPSCSHIQMGHVYPEKGAKTEPEAKKISREELL